MELFSLMRRYAVANPYLRLHVAEYSRECFGMTTRTVTTIAAVFAALLTLSACGNTIRGLGRDTANAVDATQDAGRRVDRAASR
jgi:predicted small secreted protein